MYIYIYIYIYIYNGPAHNGPALRARTGARGLGDPGKRSQGVAISSLIQIKYLSTAT